MDNPGPVKSLAAAHRLRILGRYRCDMSMLERIVSDPAVGHGQPTVRGLRYTVENLLELSTRGVQGG